MSDKPLATLSIAVHRKMIIVSISRPGGGMAMSAMERIGPGSWKGTEKHKVLEERLAELFDDCDAEEVDELMSTATSLGMDLLNVIEDGDG